MRSSVTLADATAPVKLPTCHCLRTGLRSWVRRFIQQGWYPTGASTEASARGSKAPTYPVQPAQPFNIRLQENPTGTFRPDEVNEHFHAYYNFTGSLV